MHVVRVRPGPATHLNVVEVSSTMDRHARRTDRVSVKEPGLWPLIFTWRLVFSAVSLCRVLRVRRVL